MLTDKIKIPRKLKKILKKFNKKYKNNRYIIYKNEVFYFSEFLSCYYKKTIKNYSENKIFFTRIYKNIYAGYVGMHRTFTPKK